MEGNAEIFETGKKQRRTIMTSKIK